MASSPTRDNASTAPALRLLPPLVLAAALELLAAADTVEEAVFVEIPGALLVACMRLEV